MCPVPAELSSNNDKMRTIVSNQNLQTESARQRAVCCNAMFVLQCATTQARHLNHFSNSKVLGHLRRAEHRQSQWLITCAVTAPVDLQHTRTH